MKSKNFPADVVGPLTAPAGGVVEGLGYQIGAQLFVVAVETAAAGADFYGARTGGFDMPCLTTDVIAVGAPLFWNLTNNEWQLTTGAGHVQAAIAISAAGNGVTRVEVALNGVGQAVV